MPYCSNCGDHVGETHHYCGNCGQALSPIANTEEEAPTTIHRQGFLSNRSLSYITALAKGEQTLDRDTLSHKQLQREVNAAFADFARLATVDELNLLLLWANGSGSTPIGSSPEKMSTEEIENRLAAVGLFRTLKMYDDALGTDFRDEFNDRIQRFLELAEEHLEEAGSGDREP